MTNKMKLVVTGKGRHGKDTVCEYIRDTYNLKFTSSSWFCANLYFNAHRDIYKSIDDCYSDRHNHRADWFNFICNYCKDDLSRLSREIFESNDIYCGIRNIDEFNAAKEKGLFNYSIWIDASERMGNTESKDSITISEKDCDFTIYNNSTLEDLYKQIDTLFAEII